MAEWVKVEFYGRLPEGETIADVEELLRDLGSDAALILAEELAGHFGFTHLDQLAVTPAAHIE